MTFRKKITEKGTRNLGAFFIFYPYLCKQNSKLNKKR